VLKLTQVTTALALADWFTPYNEPYLSSNDLDLNDGVLILPDQPGPYPHELIAEGKEGTIYVLNRDNMGQFCSTCTTGDTQIVQEVPQGAGKESGTPVYWNNIVYFTGTSNPVLAYSLSNGALVVPAGVQSSKIGGGGHAIITANGNSNGILWFISGALWAMDANTLNTLYISNQAANGRDSLPGVAHFATPIAADGKLFIGTQNSLVVYGLLSGH
jgi:outer membrane protein assembly factor BamB